MGKNKKRKRAGKHLEKLVMMQKMKKQQQQQAGKNEDEEGEVQDDKDIILITNISSSSSTAKTDPSPAADDEDEQPSSVEISQRDLDICIRALQHIPPHLVQSSTMCRDLRRAMHPHVLRQMKSYETVDYRVKVTSALSLRQWPVAMQALQACRDFRQLPKQGTVQRWVRDCNDGPAVWKLKLLTAILSVGNNDDTAISSHGDGDGDGGKNQHDPGHALASAAASTSDEDLIVLEPWYVPSSLDEEEEKQEEETKESTTTSDNQNSNKNTTSSSSLPEFPIPDNQKIVIYREEASERKPPNNYDLLLHYTAKPAFQLLDSDDDASISIRKHEIDFLTQPEGVTSPFVLENVLTQDECRRLMAAATTLGYRPDHPVSLDRPTGIDSCEWLMNNDNAAICTILMKRVQNHLPPTVTYNNNRHKKFQLHSINARWRFFRYARNCVYRPHIDGSWPASFVETTEEGEYQYTTESSSLDSTKKETRSYLTFLMYLNDDFTGGHTRFYQPTNDGKMSARGVQPKQGSVLVFPQGNTASLIHEGSAVTEGTKYVVRTDVIYVQQQEQQE
jgi:hypothetical protein